MKGDVVLFETPGPDSMVLAGNVASFMERTEHVRISGYPLPVLAGDCLLASDCFSAVAGPIREAEQAAKELAIKQAAEEEAKSKAAQEAASAPTAAQTPPPVIQTPPSQQNAS